MFNKIIIAIGPKRVGKTRKVSEVVRGLPRTATFDIVRDAQYTEGATVVRGRPADFANAIRPEKFNVVYQPTIRELKDNGLMDVPEFQPLCKLCHARGDMYFIIDEAHLICNSRNCPSELALASMIGGHSGFSMILIAQSFTGIHVALRRNADEFYFWKIIEPNDLDGIADRCGDEVRDQVAALRATESDDNEQFKSAGQMLHWTKNKGVVEITP